MSLAAGIIRLQRSKVRGPMGPGFCCWPRNEPMAIPDFQTIMRPIPEHLAEVGKARNRDADEYLAARLRLSQEELEELLPSGRCRLLTQ